MRKVYDQAVATPGQPVEFTWNNKGFNQSFGQLIIDSEGRTIGAFAGNVTGTMTANESGGYTVEGTMKIIKERPYEWAQDREPKDNSWGAWADTKAKNLAIGFGGSRINYQGPGDGPPDIASARKSELIGAKLYSDGNPVKLEFNREYNFQAWGKGTK